MNYTKEIVFTVKGQTRVMTNEMRKLMKEGITRKLIPANEFKGPRLKLDKASRSEISSLKKDIQRLKHYISKLEYEKTRPGVSESDIRDMNRDIELYTFDIFEAQTKIRDIKIKCYKNQTSIIDLDA